MFQTLKASSPDNQIVKELVKHKIAQKRQRQEVYRTGKNCKCKNYFAQRRNSEQNLLFLLALLLH